MNAKDQFDNTPLHCAATEEIVKLLTNAGAKVNAVNAEGNTVIEKEKKRKMFEFYFVSFSFL